MKHTLHLLLTALALALILPSCAPHRPRAQVIRTTTSHPAGFGLAAGTTTTETPYEAPSYTEGVKNLFSR